MDSYKAILIIFYFLLPANFLLILTPQKLKKYFLVFSFLSILQLFLFNSGISLPNWHNIEWLIILAAIYQIITFSKHRIHVHILLIFTFFFFHMHILIKNPIKSISLLGLSEINNNSNSDKINLSYFSSSEVKDFIKFNKCLSKGDFKFKTAEEIKELSLLASLMGTRSYFHANASRNYTITLDFIDTEESVSKTNDDNCE
jgi:hypothetical protein